MVEADSAEVLHSIFWPDHDLARNAVDRAADCCDKHGVHDRYDAGATEHDDRPLLIRRVEGMQPDVAALYSSGHANAIGGSNKSSTGPPE